MTQKIRYSETQTQSYAGYGGSNRRNAAPPKPSQWYAGNEYTWDETIQDYVRWVKKGQNSFPIKLSDEMAKNSGFRDVRAYDTYNSAFRHKWSPDQDPNTLARNLAKYTADMLDDVLVRAKPDSDVYKLLKERAERLREDSDAKHLKSVLNDTLSSLRWLHSKDGDDVYKTAANELERNLQQLGEETRRVREESLANLGYERERKLTKQEFEISTLEKDLEGLRRMQAVYDSDDVKEVADELEKHIEQLKQKQEDDLSGKTFLREYRNKRLDQITSDIQVYETLLRELDEKEQKRKRDADLYKTDESEATEPLKEALKELDDFYSDNGFDRNKTLRDNIIEVQNHAAHECERLNSRLEGLNDFRSVKQFADANKADEKAQEYVRSYAAFLEIDPKYSNEAIDKECDEIQKQIASLVDSGKNAEKIALEFIEKAVQQDYLHELYVGRRKDLETFVITPQEVDDTLQKTQKRIDENKNGKWGDIERKREKYNNKLETLRNLYDETFERLSPEEKEARRIKELSYEKEFYEKILNDKTEQAYRHRVREINRHENDTRKLEDKIQSYEKQAPIVAEFQRKFDITPEIYDKMSKLDTELNETKRELNDAKEARRALKRTHIKNLRGFEVNLPVSLDDLPRSMPPDDRLKKIISLDESYSSEKLQLDKLREAYNTLINYRDQCRKKARDFKIDRLEERAEKLELRHKRLAKHIADYKQAVTEKLDEVEISDFVRLAQKTGLEEINEHLKEFPRDEFWLAAKYFAKLKPWEEPDYNHWKIKEYIRKEPELKSIIERRRLPLFKNPDDVIAPLREDLEKKINYKENNPDQFTVDDILQDRRNARKRLEEIDNELKTKFGYEPDQSLDEIETKRDEANKQADATANTKLETLRQSPTYKAVHDEQSVLVEHQKTAFNSSDYTLTNTVSCPVSDVTEFIKTGKVSDSQKRNVANMLTSSGLAIEGRDTQLLKKMRSNDDFRKNVGRYIAGINLIMATPALRSLVSKSQEIFPNNTNPEYFSEEYLRKQFASHAKRAKRLRSLINKTKAKRDAMVPKLEKLRKEYLQQPKPVVEIVDDPSGIINYATGERKKNRVLHAPPEYWRLQDEYYASNREYSRLDSFVDENESKAEQIEKTWGPEQADAFISMLHNLSKKEMREWCDIGIRYDDEHKCFVRSRLYNTTKPELSRCDISVVSYALAKTLEDPRDYGKPKKRRYGGPDYGDLGYMVANKSVVPDEISPLSILEPGKHSEQDTATFPYWKPSSHGRSKALDRCSQAIADSSDGLISTSSHGGVRLNGDTSSADILTQILNKS